MRARNPFVDAARKLPAQEAPNRKYCGLSGQEKARPAGSPPKRRLHALICRNCGKSFVPLRHNQLDCCLACHHQWINRRRKKERAEARLREWRLARGWSREEAERMNAALHGALDPCPM